MALSPHVAAGRADLGEALRRLCELGPPSEIRSHAAAHAAAAVGLDRALLSSVVESRLVVEAFHGGAGHAEDARTREALQASPVAIEYPLVESEIVRRRRSQLVEVDSGAPTRHAFGALLGWEGSYVVAPVMFESRVAGLLHGDRGARGAPLDDDDAARLGSFALCLALVFERAVLRQRLRTQQLDLRRIASWAESRTGRLSDGSIALSEPDAHSASVARADPGAAGGATSESLRGLLTKRETEVLELIVQGETNAAIARRLVLSPGTVKFHVQNILRKLQATNRAEAISRYLRATMRR